MPLRLVYVIVFATLLAGCAVPAVPTPTPDPGKAALAYRFDMATAINGFSDAMKEMGVATQAPNVSDQKWRDGVLANLAAIRDVEPKLAAITPPAALAESHAKVRDAYKICVAAADKMEPGIEAGKVDYAGLYGASALFEQCAQAMKGPLDEIVAYAQQFE